VRVKVQTSEVEPNMVVLRSGYRGKWGMRTLLPLKIENRIGDQYIHTYENTVRAQPRPGCFMQLLRRSPRVVMRYGGACLDKVLGYPVYGAIDVALWIPTWLLLRGTAGASFTFKLALLSFCDK